MAMNHLKPLPREFYLPSAKVVAPRLLGHYLLRRTPHGLAGGPIVETEAYIKNDPACHGYIGPTNRNRVMFGPPGRAYVYLSYGIHSLLNAVAEPEGEAAAVLIRALEPTDGLEAMRERRGDRPDGELCSGPGKLTEALGIGLEQNDTDLAADPFLLLPPVGEPPAIVTGPRIGITKAVERPWRFCAAGSPFVSRPRPPRPNLR